MKEERALIDNYKLIIDTDLMAYSTYQANR